MMTMANKQRGLTLSGFMVIAVLFIVLAIFGMKIIPVYIEDRTIKSIFDAISRDPDMQNATIRDIRMSYNHRALVNNLTSINMDDINVDKGPGGLVLSVSYSRKIPLVANASLLFEFDTASSSKR